MFESLKARWTVIGMTMVIGIIWILPNFVDLGKDWFLSKDKIIYGLDIRGGLHLVMGVDVDSVIIEKTKRMATNFAKELDERSLKHESVTIPPDNEKRIIIDVGAGGSVAAVTKYIEEFYPVTLQILSTEGTQLVIQYYDAKVLEYKKQIISQAIEVIRNRIDEFGVSEPSITAQGDSRILVQLPGIENAAQAKELINRAARLDFLVVSEEMTGEQLTMIVTDAESAGAYTLGKKDSQGEVKEGGLDYTAYIKRLNEDIKTKLPENTKLVFEKANNAVSLTNGKIPYLVKTDTDLSGDQLEDAVVRPGEFGAPEVIFRFTVEGRRKFADITEQNVKKLVAIVLDDVVQSAPVIKERIDSATARITLGGSGQETQNEAQFIATALRAGALPAALEQLEERTVGPTLGADSIAKGKIAGMVGGILVLVFMLLYYRMLGVIANIALTVNIFLLLAILTSLGATLTLPGVAGIVLTVGMAVDANVIIFERIKEELRKGSSLQAAIKDGFGHAFSAIFDANITTAVVCIVLMYFGTGPVRGFAVTLLCGIVTSMFTAIFVSRTIMDWLVIRMKFTKLVTVNN